MRGLSKITTIGVIGAGTMGGGIASSAALAGFRILLYDLNAGIAEKSIEKIAGGFKKLLEKKKIDRAAVDSSVQRLKGISNHAELAGCDFVIEAAAEDMNIKKELFSSLEKIVPEDVILATNTSSLSVTTISTALKINKERVVGMHFFNPANIMKLVEVIKGEFTSSEVMNIVAELSRTMGKVPVICKDTPAFIVNRVARAFYGEALKILGEGSLTVESIDMIMKEEGGFAMGPFELMDLIGIDVNYSVTRSVYEAFFHDQKYKPSPIQQKMVEANLLGRKTGQGFYKY